MTNSYQLKMGKRVEKEHTGTLLKERAYHKKTGKCMPISQVEENIAKDHIKEDKNYYTKLKKAKL